MWLCISFLANRNSGNNEGGSILSAFHRLLHPLQVIDLGEKTPETGLQWLHLLGEVKCRILIAGGDGTIGWVLSTIEKLNIQVCRMHYSIRS